MAKGRDLILGCGLAVVTCVMWLVSSCTQSGANSVSSQPIIVTNSTATSSTTNETTTLSKSTTVITSTTTQSPTASASHSDKNPNNQYLPHPL